VKSENRYLARQLCYVLTIEGLDTYIVQPGDPVDLQILIESLRPGPQPGDVDVVVGRRGPIAPPDLCNGLMVPMVEARSLGVIADRSAEMSASNSVSSGVV
jgi:hypothetical protein